MSAREFKDMMTDGKPDLSKIEFAVFGVGDTRYEFFSKATDTMEQLFEQNGATKIAPGVKSNTAEYESDFLRWVKIITPLVEKFNGVQQEGLVQLAALASLQVQI